MKNLYSIAHKDQLTGHFRTKVVTSKDWHLCRQRCRNALYDVDTNWGEKAYRGKGHYKNKTIEGMKITNHYGETVMEGYFIKEQVK